ncbi:ELECTRON CARRIER/IRON ION-BINDING PROTEIN [Salix purpurea]|uniref:ELECTRON CARRIER/IRON ION-BINDING PROTEIN n=1 Tax=Salix purpurea TaxID=77065 RepID=A0A9Q0QGT2_SALPP|nr:ELECTRON CARRIER/IRON ION-BINDING PROTEIN [Salix purpurea]
MSNNSSETGQTSISTAAGGTTSFSAPPKTLRGLNKPKCIQCGNVARSRCPYQSCKSCCSRAQNPCHIHVLGGSLSYYGTKQLMGQT